MVGKAPSEGTKVTLGENAPVTREATGPVPGDSLAAESLSSGGAFTSNPVTSSSTETNNQAFSTRPHETPDQYQHHHQTDTEQGQTAPSYVNIPSAVSSSHEQQGAGKPHGKNITQDDDMIGRPGKFDVEVGGKEDPSREALRAMRLKQTRGAPGTGEREVGVRGPQGEGGDEQPYAALGGETSA